MKKSRLVCCVILCLILIGQCTVVFAAAGTPNLTATTAQVVMNGSGLPAGLRTIASNRVYLNGLPSERWVKSYQHPEEYYPYRAMLTEQEKAVYDRVYAYAMDMYDSLPLKSPVSIESTVRAVSSVFYDHPELFWVNTEFQYIHDEYSRVVAVLLSFNGTAQNIESHRTQFNSVVQKVVEEASKLNRAVDKEKYVHDYLVDNVSYNTNAPRNQSAYSALVDGETVCSGYARAFQHIMIQLEIPCYFVVGKTQEDHAWNIVKLGDGYYNVDVNWDDSLGVSYGKRVYSYFNITDATINTNHTRTDLAVNLPACNATTYSYANVYGG